MTKLRYVLALLATLTWLTCPDVLTAATNPPPVSYLTSASVTPYTRDFLRATNAAHFSSLAGIATNATTLPDPIAGNFVGNGSRLTNVNVWNTNTTIFRLYNPRAENILACRPADEFTGPVLYVGDETHFRAISLQVCNSNSVGLGEALTNINPRISLVLGYDTNYAEIAWRFREFGLYDNADHELLGHDNSGNVRLAGTNGNVTTKGQLMAESFIGNGAKLTNVEAVSAVMVTNAENQVAIVWDAENFCWDAQIDMRASSFTGSLIGDGAGITNVPSAAIVAPGTSLFTGAVLVTNGVTRVTFRITNGVVHAVTSP